MKYVCWLKTVSQSYGLENNPSKPGRIKSPIYRNQFTRQFWMAHMEIAVGRNIQPKGFGASNGAVNGLSWFMQWTVPESIFYRWSNLLACLRPNDGSSGCINMVLQNMVFSWYEKNTQYDQANNLSHIIPLMNHWRLSYMIPTKKHKPLGSWGWFMAVYHIDVPVKTPPFIRDFQFFWKCEIHLQHTPGQVLSEPSRRSAALSDPHGKAWRRRQYDTLQCVICRNSESYSM